MAKQINAYADLREVEIFIPKEMLKDYFLGEVSLAFTLSREDAKQLQDELAELGLE
ncbi:hypothetical protein D3C87_777720 [compost metagenome]